MLPAQACDKRNGDLLHSAGDQYFVPSLTKYGHWVAKEVHMRRMADVDQKPHGISFAGGGLFVLQQ